LLIGAGAQGRVVLDSWRQQHPARRFVFLDDQRALWGTQLLGVPIEGGLEQITAYAGEAVLSVGNNQLRRALAQRFAAMGQCFARVVHPSAAVLPTAVVAPGAVILAGAVVNTQAFIGQHAIVNSGAIVEHDCQIGDFASLGPGVCMAGRVEIGAGAFLSTGVSVAPRIKIGAGTVVGAGAVVVSDLPEGVLAYGVPARVVRPLGSDFDWRRLL
jgi:sugar O-acyltransferase (sialic acid O-acetyltransferase NeuD family)